MKLRRMKLRRSRWNWWLLLGVVFALSAWALATYIAA